MGDGSLRTSDEKPWQKPDKKPGWYERLTAADKWEFHAETYAWRRVWLGVPDYVRTSPCDPKSEWFDEELVHQASLRVADEYIKRFDKVLDEPWAASAWGPDGRIKRREALRQQDAVYRRAEDYRADQKRRAEAAE